MADIARKVMRDVRNRWSYEDVENFVRDATSNTNDPPTPQQIKQIANAMLYYEAYPKAFQMLWRRLTHLEYKRHVAKALLVLDHLVRIRPPSKAIQLKLMVDIRERWPEIYRLAKLRPSSSSETIAQIQRVAERLCAFIMGYEAGYIRPDDEPSDEESEEEEEEGDQSHGEKRKKRKVKRKKKKTTTTIEEEVDDEDNNNSNNGQSQRPKSQNNNQHDDYDGMADDEIRDELSKLPPTQNNQNHQRKDTLPPVSPYGFDFFQHTNFDWTPAPSAQKPTQAQTQKRAVPAVSGGWDCAQCTYHNVDESANECEVCGFSRHQKMEQKDVHLSPSGPDHDAKEEQVDGWSCEHCSFFNRPDIDVCEVCERRRGDHSQAMSDVVGEGETGGEGYPREGEMNDVAAERKDGSTLEKLEGSSLPGAWACSWCSWLNPPTAILCEVCDKERAKSNMAQQVKLEMARKHEGLQNRPALPSSTPVLRQSWQCTYCSKINPANRTDCSGCGSQSPYATELMLTGGAGSAYTSTQSSPQLSPRSQSRRATGETGDISRKIASLGAAPPPPYQAAPSGPLQSRPPLNQQSSRLALSESSLHPPIRSSGFASGYAAPDYRSNSPESEYGKRDEEDGVDDSGGELVEMVRHQQDEMVHQVAALQHYNKEKEKYREQYGWECSVCTLKNDPHLVRCDACGAPRPPIVNRQTAAQQQQQLQAQQALNQAQSAVQRQSAPLAAPVSASLPRAHSMQVPASVPVSVSVSASSMVNQYLQQAAPPQQQPADSRPKPIQRMSTVAAPHHIDQHQYTQQQQQQQQQKPQPYQREQEQPRGQYQQQQSWQQHVPIQQQPSLSAAVPVSGSAASVDRARPASSSNLVVPPSAASSAAPMSQSAPTEWSCSKCTYLNPINDENCAMCDEPRPANVSANIVSNNTNLSQVVAPPLPSALPSTNPRRSTHPLPSNSIRPSPSPSMATTSSSPTSNRPPLPSAGPVVPPEKLSVLEAIPPSGERGPAPVPAPEPKFPPQYQLEQQQVAYAQELARQQAAVEQYQKQQYAQQQRIATQEMLRATAAQELHALPPLSSLPPVAMRQSLTQGEQWIAEQHKQQQQNAWQQTLEEPPKGNLDQLMNDFFTPRRADQPVELRPEAVERSQTAGSLSSYPVARPQEGNFDHMFDQAADGFAKDLLQRKSSGESPSPTPQIQIQQQQPSQLLSASVSDAIDPQRAISAPSISPSARRKDSIPKARSRPVAEPLPLEQLKAPLPSKSPPTTAPAGAAPAATPSVPTIKPILPISPPPAVSVSPPAPLAANLTLPQRHESPPFSVDLVSVQNAPFPAFSPLNQPPINPFESIEGEQNPQPKQQRKQQQQQRQQQDTIVEAHAVSPTSPAPSPHQPPMLSTKLREREQQQQQQQQQLLQAQYAYLQQQQQPQRAARMLQGEQENKKNTAEKVAVLAPALTVSVTAPSTTIVPSIITNNNAISSSSPPATPVGSALAAALAHSANQRATEQAKQPPSAVADTAVKVDVKPTPSHAAPQVLPISAVSVSISAQQIQPRQQQQQAADDKEKEKRSLIKPSALEVKRLDSDRQLLDVKDEDHEQPTTPISQNRPSSSQSGRRSPSSLEYRAETREKVRQEILSTEKFYVECLQDLTKHYMLPIQKQGPKMGVEPKHVSAIFGNLTMLTQFHTIFLGDLKKNPNTAEVFVQFADFLKMYTQYIAGYEKSIATINSLRANKAFQKLLEDKRDELKGRGIMTYLIMPVQRIPRYVLLLRELKKYTAADHPEQEALSLALTKIESIAEHVNENKRHVEQMSKLLDIQNRLKKTDVVIFKPDRRLIKEGMIRRLKEEYVLERSNMEPYSHDIEKQLFFLFNDLLVWTTEEFDLVGNVPLDNLLCLPDQVHFKVPNTLSLGVRNSAFRPDMVFVCKDQAEKDEWNRYILSAINTATDPTKQRKKALAANSNNNNPGKSTSPLPGVPTITSATQRISAIAGPDHYGFDHTPSKPQPPPPPPTIATAAAAAAAAHAQRIAASPPPPPSMNIQPPPTPPSMNNDNQGGSAPAMISMPPPSVTTSVPVRAPMSSAELLEQHMKKNIHKGNNGNNNNSNNGSAPNSIHQETPQQIDVTIKPPPLLSQTTHVPPPLLSQSLSQHPSPPDTAVANGDSDEKKHSVPVSNARSRSNNAAKYEVD